MKKHLSLAVNLLFVMISFGLSESALAQNNSKIFDYNVPAVWLGVDFSEARYIPGAEDNTSGNNLKEVFERINGVIVNEPDKYKLKNRFYKQEITDDLSTVSAINEKINPANIVSESSADYTRMDEAFIKKMVGKYKIKKQDKVGIVIIMEGMNKRLPQASMWVTFIDLSNHQVLLTKRMTGKPGGFGLRNFWASSISKVLEEVEKSAYNKWKKENR